MSLSDRILNYRLLINIPFHATAFALQKGLAIKLVYNNRNDLAKDESDIIADDVMKYNLVKKCGAQVAFDNIKCALTILWLNNCSPVVSFDTHFDHWIAPTTPGAEELLSITEKPLRKRVIFRSYRGVPGIVYRVSRTSDVILDENYEVFTKAGF